MVEVPQPIHMERLCGLRIAAGYRVIRGRRDVAIRDRPHAGELEPEGGVKAGIDELISVCKRDGDEESTQRRCRAYHDRSAAVLVGQASACAMIRRKKES